MTANSINALLSLMTEHNMFLKLSLGSLFFVHITVSHPYGLLHQLFKNQRAINSCIYTLVIVLF